MKKWAGKVAVVTGASAGIGRAIVYNLVKHGINVVALDRRRVELIDEYAKELSTLSGKIYAKKCDVSDLQSVQTTFKWIEEKFTSVSILVNNAAVIFPDDITKEEEGIEQKFRTVFDTNLFGPIYCARATIKMMKKSGDHGIIININSVAGTKTVDFAGLGFYSASKFALRSLSEHLHLELVRQNNRKIRISSICPAGVKTDMLKTAMKKAGVKALTLLEADVIPSLRPEDIAQTVQFLLETPVTVNIAELVVKSPGEAV
jgi:NADP+-dependent farnesol dehydrogenase